MSRREAMNPNFRAFGLTGPENESIVSTRPVIGLSQKLTFQINYFSNFTSFAAPGVKKHSIRQVFIKKFHFTARKAKPLSPESTILTGEVVLM